MRIRAAAFALALGIATPAIGAPSITEWSDEQFVVMLQEIGEIGRSCKDRMAPDVAKLVAVTDVALERPSFLSFVKENQERYAEILQKIEQARETPATFCWIMMEKYGPEGTVLPGMVKAR